MSDVDPGYGGYANTNRLLATATNSPEQFGQQINNARGAVALNQQQFDLASGRIKALHDVASSILADPTKANLTQRLGEAVKAGVIPQDMANQAFATTSGMADGPQIQQWAFQHVQALGDYNQRLQAAYGAPGLANTGNALTPTMTRTGPQGGVTAAGGAPIPLQQSPSELATPVMVKDATGRESTMTQGQFQSTVGQPPNSWVDVSKGNARVVNGKIVYDKTTPPAAAAPPAAAPVTLPGIAGPAPGAVAAATDTAAASAGMGNALTKAADDATNRRATLSNLQDMADKIVTGPGAEKVNTAKAGANAVGDMLGVPASIRFDPKTIAATEEFHKNAEILAQQQQASLGGTDAALASGKASNPNLGLSTMGNKQILAMLQGNEDAIQAKNAAWQAYKAKNGPDSYSQFAADFNKSFSPRAFQFAHMSVADRKEAVKGLNPQDRAALSNALDYAESQGWIKAP